MEPLVTLFEEPGAGGELPGPLAALYGGAGLGLAADLVYANFVSSLDGVVALDAQRGAAPALRGRCDADRFVMGLLRSLADAVIVGRGTLRADGGHPWTSTFIDRDRADVYRALGRGAPRLVVVTASGELDPVTPAMEAGALVLTTVAGARRLRGRLPAACVVRPLGSGPLGAASLVAAVRAEGHRRLLTEGGPTLLGRLVAEGALDELFLTLSPVLAGRQAGDGRLGLVEGVRLLPEAGRWSRLRSVRAAGSHLFLRYALLTSDARAPSTR